VQQKRIGVGKIAKIILFFYCISTIYLTFNKNCWGGG